MSDLLALAFQADLTRVATFVLANDGSNRSYGPLGVPEGHHDLSHHGGDASKQEKLRRINQFHTAQLAYLLERLRSTDQPVPLAARSDGGLGGLLRQQHRASRVPRRVRP